MTETVLLLCDLSTGQELSEQELQDRRFGGLDPEPGLTKHTTRMKRLSQGLNGSFPLSARLCLPVVYVCMILHPPQSSLPRPHLPFPHVTLTHLHYIPLPPVMSSLTAQNSHP